MDRFKAHDIAWKGRKLTKAEAAQLESLLSADKADIDDRIRLLGYYFNKTPWNEENQALAVRHVTWIINNSPEHGILSWPEGTLVTLEEEPEVQWIKFHPNVLNFRFVRVACARSEEHIKLDCHATPN